MRLTRPALALGALAALALAGLTLTGTAAIATETPGAATAEASGILPSEGIRWLTDKLRQKEHTLDHREATLAAREADLRLAEKKLDDRMRELRALREELGALLSQMDAAREERIVALVRMFEGMRPREAAPILATTETEVALEVLKRMNTMKAGKILAEMEPAVASTLAERFAAGPALGPGEPTP